jgi:Kef-type K+ transport system membrane component KefB
MVSTELLLILLCSLIILSYFFSIISQYVKVPSVLLLLFAGIGFRAVADANGFTLLLPGSVVEGLGVVGLIMIVLEAGLDLKLSREKGKLILDSFLAALVILVVSTALLAGILHWWLHEDIRKCIIYALPLSIMSSSIVLPSIHHLTREKKEFLIYEASFSDIIGILLFNYFAANEILTLWSVGSFGLSLAVAILLSLVLSFFLFLLLARTKMNIKFFLVFSLLILIYTGGKMMHLPSLLIILAFGLMINNWEKIPAKKLVNLFPKKEVEVLREFLHSITAESSFLVRTFFFILFGFTIDLKFLRNTEVLLVGGLIVLALFLVRYFYLRFFFKTKIFPEVFFIPRGLVTIVLFYKIPTSMKLSAFNDDILFFIILATGVIMSVGMMMYKKKSHEIVEDLPFFEPKDNLLTRHILKPTGSRTSFT